MAQTKNDVVVPSDDWISINTSTGIAVGTKMYIQNKSTTWVLLVESVSKPALNYSGGVFLTDLSHGEPSKVVTDGSIQVWAKSTVDGRSATISVQ